MDDPSALDGKQRVDNGGVFVASSYSPMCEKRPHAMTCRVPVDAAMENRMCRVMALDVRRWDGGQHIYPMRGINHERTEALRNIGHRTQTRRGNVRPKILPA